MISTVPWWTCLLPLLRLFATALLMSIAGLLQRCTTGQWPTVDDWRTPNPVLPTPSSVIARTFDLLRTRRKAS